MISPTLARLAALAFVSLLLAVVPARAADPTFPELNGRRVVDEAHILSAADRASLTDEMAALEARNTDQVVVVTVPSLQGVEIEDYGYKLGRRWQIGQKGLNNGLLLIVAPAERKVRIEVGYGLEDVMTDAMSSHILQEDVLPRFRRNDYPGGISEGVSDIIEQLSLDKTQAKAKIEAVKKSSKKWNTLIVLSPHIIIWGGLLLLLLIRNLVPLRFLPRWFRKGSGATSTKSGGWSSGGSSGSSDSGGSFSDDSFSGGGGDFGGGGASGSW
jgi:uncharacterized protein